MDKLHEEYNDIPEKLILEAEKISDEYKLTKAQLKKVLDRLREEYESAKINPGEGIGIITAESFGEPGTQMSIAKNEKVIIKIKDKIKILEIGKFVDSLVKINGSLKVNDSEIVPLNDYEAYAPSLNQEEKVEWKRIIECSRHKTNKKLLKLITKSGRSIIATDNHSFVTRKNNKIMPVIGRELSIGNRIPVIKYLPEHCIEEIELKSYMDIKEDTRFKVIESDERLIREKTLAKSLPKKLNLDKLFGFFIGAYLAEGNATNGQINISNIDDSFIYNIKEFTNKVLGLGYKEEYHQRGFSFSRDIKINSSLFANFIKTICKTGSYNKEIPEFSYSAKEEFVAGLLRGYFDGDGNFSVKRDMIRASSNSKELIDGVALLLTRFKIFSYKTKDKKGQYWLLIPYKYAPLFLMNVGSSIEHKKIALEKLAEKAKIFLNEKSQDYNDMISGFDSLFYDVAKKLDYPTRYINNFTKRQKIGRTALFRHMKIFENIAKEKNIDIKNELKIMNRMFYSDIVWDSIEKIEYIDNEDYVYDLSVPGLETFTTFEGIITHNTLNVFHFAGVAEVAVTRGLPRLIEIFDARKEPSTPKLTVYLEKDYKNDEKKVREVAALLKETKLKDIATEFSLNLSEFKIEIVLDYEKLKMIKLKDEQVMNAVKEGLKDVNVKQTKDGFNIKYKAETPSLKDIYLLKEKCKDINIRGVKGIKQVLPKKEDAEYIIYCSGDNLKEVFNIDGVDKTRTVTNNIFAMAEVLGIEAARQAIINESLEVIQNQGLNVDIRHTMLLGDVMTHSGTIKGITRTGITNEKESVLARASFETPINHIVKACMKGEEDKLVSVIENVMVNQPVPIGTGLPSLVAKMKDSKAKSK